MTPPPFDQAHDRTRHDVSPRNSSPVLARREWALLLSVYSELDLDPALDLSDVDVAIDGQCVNLAGSVPGIATRIRIERAVARVSGVSTIDNRLHLASTGRP